MLVQAPGSSDQMLTVIMGGNYIFLLIGSKYGGIPKINFLGAMHGGESKGEPVMATTLSSIFQMRVFIMASYTDVHCFAGRTHLLESRMIN